MTFDPAYLTVVDWAGNPTTSIVATSAFDVVLSNLADNEAGFIRYSAAQFLNPPVTNRFVLARMRFKAIRATPYTVIHLSTEAEPCRSMLVYGGANVLAGVLDGIVIITGGSDATSTDTPRGFSFDQP